ncbi:aminopeptidase [Streptomyces sp. AJS327]|uniref:S28 family serine protease n=1 Tax=Streptomyces sp. AJS327 TaxID=2545265 RepID=UPI0015DEAD66|nr:S28 family serine protease [Streptomyces sp. AJS327]MBA0049684.1 aminopeptidase [Streptomyces sp. AJS327]
MRRTIRWLLSLAMVAGTVGAGSLTAGAATAAEPREDIKDRILAVPGMSLIEEQPTDDGYRFFLLNYEQPVDHRKPDGKTFQQRISILHTSETRPTVFFTSGYGLREEPARSEPTQLVDGNQVSMEYRYFTPSRPDPADWNKLDIWQAASDQHRITTALRSIYDQKWISTGGSKGGMTATYYRRFYPKDMDGTVAYVAPNDVNNKEDSAYEEFFRNVGSKECRDRLNGVQHEIFERREEFVPRIEEWAEKEGHTFELAGDADRAFEIVAQDLVWGYWQYHLDADCGEVPSRDASTDELYTWANEIGGWEAGTDQGMLPYTPYYYQAGTQLGSPDYEDPLLDDVRKYPGINVPRTYVPRDIPMSFDKKAMKDIDKWVRKDASEMLFVNGENDPWSAEPFRLGPGTEDSYLYTAPDQNHGANIAKLSADDRESATRALLRWAGVDQEVRPGAVPKRLTQHNPALDKPQERSMTLRP